MTISAALPILARLGRKEGMLRQVLGCRGQPHMHPVDPGVSVETPDLDWSHCPLDLLRGSHMMAIRELRNLATPSTPLVGWPVAFKPWAVVGVMLTRGD